ncbi:semaphorin-7A isoform X2 [Genypterus blacodes]|uniref:semaphorin-7A isoform X2 n=1 Tax=Genypterus blacodes TaxID=154954 RepID=UPI003F76FC59
MRHLVLLHLWLAAHFQPILIVGCSKTPFLGEGNIPRLLLSKDGINTALEYDVYQDHTVFFYDEESEELYVGVAGTLFKRGLDKFDVIEGFPLEQKEQQLPCSQGSCANVITVIEKLQGDLFVCGTNGVNPWCRNLPSPENNQSQDIKIYKAEGISPVVHTHNSLSITVDGVLYAAAPLDGEGKTTQFRRKLSDTDVWMDVSWVSEPTFISAEWVKRKEDPDNEKIFIFFREKNEISKDRPDTYPWITRVARVCKVDEGGPKLQLQQKWTSFLKARLVCGFPDEWLYFNRLLGVFVLHAEDWRETRVYALFTSSWKSTAVCVYSIEAIEDVFATSDFKGSSENPPRTCRKNSKATPTATLKVMKEHFEMSTWVHSIHPKAPFFVSSSSYTRIAVDRVQAADQNTYNILLLATDSGKIHKVLEVDSKPFIISEMQLFETQLPSQSAIQWMHLDSKKKKLMVGFPEKIMEVDLQRCQEYNKSCEDCVLARDPYCAWTSSGCNPTVPGIQNIMVGNTSVCSTAQEDSMKVNRNRRGTLLLSSVGLWRNHSVPLDVPFYLWCPIDSYHANYTWEHQGVRDGIPCQQMQSSCLHLNPAMSEEDYGEYMCVSKERDFTKVVAQYRVTKQITHNPDHNVKSKTNSAAAVVPQLLRTLTGPLLVLVGEFFT